MLGNRPVAATVHPVLIIARNISPSLSLLLALTAAFTEAGGRPVPDIQTS